jgi:UDP-glucose 4-epimerase
MRIALTGGGGFIGSHLVARMVAAGMDVTLVGPDTGKSRYVASLVARGAVKFFRCDGTFGDEDLLPRVLEGTDALVLLRYVMPTPASLPQRMLDEFDVNVAPTIRLLRAALDSTPHIVFASSVSVYGEPERPHVREDDTPRPLTPYAVAKLACEHAIAHLAAAAGRSATILRYATVYGPGETVPRAIPNFIRATLSGAQPRVNGSGLDERDYVHVADVVDATLAAMRRRASGVYNVGTGIGTATVDVARLVIRATGSSVAPVCAGARESLPPSRIICDTEAARSGLGFVARRSLAQALPEEIGWFRAQRDIRARADMGSDQTQASAHV